ncbi:MAG: hypothetical protein K5656_03075 [Lachnospiraceae bacterium]|nr:hypothetical protein [Lachnospiraceae bacterium]
MLLKSRPIAFAGMMVALAVIIVTVAGYIDISTLFFLCLAAVLGGIVEYLYGFKYGALFAAASIVLSLILAPQKMYILTYSIMAIYVIVLELYVENESKNLEKNKLRFYWIIKSLVYNALMALGVVIFAVFTGFDTLKGNRFYDILGDNLALKIVALILVIEIVMLLLDFAYVKLRKAVLLRLNRVNID